MVTKLILVYFCIGFVYVCVWCAIPGWLDRLYHRTDELIDEKYNVTAPRWVNISTMVLGLLYCLVLWPWAIMTDAVDFFKKKGKP